MKLDGYNPAIIISQEIKESTHVGRESEPALHTIIRGDPKFNIYAFNFIKIYTLDLYTVAKKLNLGIISSLTKMYILEPK